LLFWSNKFRTSIICLAAILGPFLRYTDYAAYKKIIIIITII